MSGRKASKARGNSCSTGPGFPVNDRGQSIMDVVGGTAQMTRVFGGVVVDGSLTVERNWPSQSPVLETAAVKTMTVTSDHPFRVEGQKHVCVISTGTCGVDGLQWISVDLIQQDPPAIKVHLAPCCTLSISPCPMPPSGFFRFGFAHRLFWPFTSRSQVQSRGWASQMGV